MTDTVTHPAALVERRGNVALITINAVEHSEVVIFDHDGDCGPGMCSSDSQSLPGDHHDTIFGNSPLHTLRPSWRR